MPQLCSIGAASARGFGLTEENAQVTDDQFNLTTLLLPGNGTNGAQNNTFLDSSTNNFTITRNGNTTQGTFSPFSQTGWSNYFDGTGDYLTTPTSDGFGFGTGTFTFEAWVFPTSNPANGPGTLIDCRSGLNAEGWVVRLFNDLTVGIYNGPSDAYVYSSGTFTMNTWNHIAIVRSNTSSGGVSFYINGVASGTGTISSNLGTTWVARIGSNRAAGYDYFGYMSNMRVVKGTAVYTSAFTPSTVPLTAITNTSLLTCQSNRFVDNSVNQFAITVNGNVSVQPFSPFQPDAAYSAANVGGSGYFDGSGDYLSVPDNSGFDLDSTFTLEGWFYQPSAGDGIIFSRGGGGASWSTTNGQEYWANLLSGSFYWQWNSSGSASAITATAPAAGAWHHFAVGYNGTTTRLWIDGVSAGTSTSNYTLPTTRNITRVGLSSFASSPFTGYISSLRVIKGTDVYGVGNTSITVPTTPLTAVTNTQLLLNYTNGGIIDATAKNVAETVGNAQISTAQSKFGGSSMLFDGSGDALILPASQNLALETGNFTIEMWVYGANNGGTVGGSYPRLFSLGTVQTTGSIESYNAAGTLYVEIFGSSITFTASTLLNSSWNHFAISRSGSSVKAFVNGTQVGSTLTNSTNLNRAASSTSIIGASTASTGNFNGYIDDLRITKGYARYTTNFTPPTQAFPLL